MALKYYFEFTDVKEVLHRCEISDENFTGDATLVYGNLATNKANTKDTLEVIRGGGLTINLEANLDLTFEDFYSENERTFLVKYYRGGVLEFIGWLSPEGLFQSYVEDKWIISLDCTDGLGFLKNLSYVDSNGFTYRGKQSVLEVIVNCLKRTNIEQNIYTYTDVRYIGQSATSNTFADTFINVNRFKKDDRGDTIMNCDEVLRSIFDIFGCCITQYKGEWIIYKPNSLKDATTSLPYFCYDYNGNALTPATKQLNLSFTLGSQINNFYPHHINGNQQISIDSGIGAYRINYKYGLVKSFTENDDLFSVGGVIQDYTILNNSYITINPNNLGFKIDTVSTVADVVELNTVINLIEGDGFKFKVEVRNDVVGSFARFTIKLVGTTTTYYLKNKTLINGGPSTNNSEFLAEWVTSYNEIRLSSNNDGVDFSPIGLFNIFSEPLPEDGQIEFKILTSGNNTFTPTGAMEILCVVFSPLTTESELKGENHTFQFNTSDISTKIEDTKEVFNGDNPSDIYIGTIYESDETTPTEKWRRLINVREIPLLRYAGEERMAMYSKPLRVFTGDVFGYVDYLSVITIDGFPNVRFMAIEHKYDALANITSLKLKEILNDAGGTNYTDVDYTLTYDYGNVVEPTIK